MAKTKISEFSTTAGNNTDINSINIAEGCAPSGINDAIRELMRQLKEFQTGGAGDSVNSGGDFSVATNKFTVASASGNTAVAGTLAVTGVATLTAQPILSSLTASKAVFTDASKGLVSNDVTGTGNVVMSNSPTLVTPALGTPASGVVTNLTGTASININGTVGATTPSTGAFTTLSSTGNTTLGDASGDTITVNGTTTFVNANPTLSAGTANGVLYLNGSKVATSGSALTFDGTQLAVTGTSPVKSIYSTNATQYTTLNYDGISVYGAQDAYYSAPSGRAQIWYLGGSEQMRLTSTGLGIGRTSFTEKLSVQNTSATSTSVGANVIAGFRSNAVGADTAIDLTDGASFSARFGQIGGALYWMPGGSSEAMRLDSSGNLLVGQTSTTSPGDGNTTAGTAIQSIGKAYFSCSTGRGLTLNRNEDGAVAGFFRSGTQVGSISVTTSATAYNTSSDYRLKENIQPMQNALGVVAQLNPVTYTWKVNGADGQGFIAHELQAVVPDCVVGEKDAVDADGNPVYQGIDTSFLVATLTAAIKEQQALIESLTTRIAALEGK